MEDLRQPPAKDIVPSVVSDCADCDAVVRAVEKGFRNHVRPTWEAWKREARTG